MREGARKDGFYHSRLRSVGSSQNGGTIHDSVGVSQTGEFKFCQALAPAMSL